MKKLHFYKIIILFIISILIINKGESQVLINSTGGTPDGSAILEVRSTTQGLLIPRMNTTERNTLAATAAEGLLVYDTDVEAFYLRGNGAWIDLSSSAEIWSQTSSNVFLTNTTKNVGVGTTTPTGKFVIKADASKTDDDVLFEIKDNSGATIMAVTSVGVRMYVENPTSKGKGISGGFAVGKYGAAKGTGDLFVVNSGSTNVYTDDDDAKGISGGFAVGKYGAAKEKGLGDIFVVTPDSTRVYTDAATGISGGFAVGKYGAAKGSADIYMHMTEENYFIGHQAGLNTNPLATGDSGKYNLFFGYQSALANTKGFQNTFVGHKTGYNNTLGRHNVFMGNKAGFSNVGGDGFAGSRNVFLGFEAGYNNTTGADNVMIGWLAGYENTTAGSNICIGSKAGYSNDTSIHNIFIGEFSGEYHKSGENNIYMGFSSGQGPSTGAGGTGEANVFIGLETGIVNTTGASNVYIGNQSGHNNTIGLNNVFLGNTTGFSNTVGANNVVLGNQAGYFTTSGNNNVFLGNDAGSRNNDGNDNVYIGNLAGYYAQDLSYNIYIGSDAGENSTGGNNNIFMGVQAGENHQVGNDNIFMGSSAGKGILLTGNTSERNVILGSNAGTYIDDAIDNIFIGHKAGEGSVSASVTGDFNVIIGEQAGNHLTSGSRNVFLGNETGNNTTTGEGNIFLGYQCGFNNTTGSYNTFMGYLAGRDNTSGADNMFIGYTAGKENTVGSNNMFIGEAAGSNNTTGSNNLFIGDKAGETNSTGQLNFCIGSSAGHGITIGTYNMCMGVGAGSSVTGGNHNLFIGQQTGNDITTGSYNIYIGELAGSGNPANQTSESNLYVGYNAAYYTKGSYNTYLGNGAGSGSNFTNDTTGSFNTFVGNGAGYDIRGDNNTTIGYQAGRGAHGSGNVYIGYDVEGHGTESNKLYIDNSNTATPLIYGEFDNDYLQINSTLNIAGNYSFPTVDGTNGQVLQTNGSGTLSWINGSSFADNLGNHSATQDLDMNAYNIIDVDKLITQSVSDYDKLRVWGHQDYTIGMHSAMTLGYVSSWATTFTMGETAGYGWVWRGATDLQSEGAMSLTYDGQFYVDNTAHFNGDVGIGTDTPGEKIEVKGDAIVGSGAAGYDGSSEHIRIAAQNDTWYLGVRNEATVGASDFFIGQTDLEDAIFHIQNDGDVGIGTYSPGAQLDVRNSGTEDILNLFDGATEVLTVEDGGDVGIGTTNPGYRMHVVDNTASNDDPAIYGIHTTTAGYGKGLYGRGNYMGVQAYVSTNYTGAVYGVYSYANNSGTGADWAGYFSGNVRVTGTFDNSKSAMSIDHPLDPENKYLYHSSVESPDMKNIYDGNVTLDENGEALVTMSDWFEALNMEFRYQLTAIGAPGPNLYIAEEISGNTFKIAGGTVGMKVSWQVTGIRHDPFADKNRIQVEVDKDANDRGKYLHPDVYNQPKEKGIDFEMLNK